MLAALAAPVQSLSAPLEKLGDSLKRFATIQAVFAVFR